MHNLTYRPLSPADAVALHKIVRIGQLCANWAAGLGPQAVHLPLGAVFRMRAATALSGLFAVMGNCADPLQ